MQVRFVNDAVRGRGCGLFVIREAPEGVGPCTFSLQRAGDGRLLGGAGWQEAEIFLTPDAETRQGNELHLAVSSDVVHRLDALETYRFGLRIGAAVPVCALLELDAVVYADAPSAHVATPPPPPPPHPAPAAAPKPDPVPEPTPEAAPERHSAFGLRRLFPVAGLAFGLVLFLYAAWPVFREQPALPLSPAAEVPETPSPASGEPVGTTSQPSQALDTAPASERPAMPEASGASVPSQAEAVPERAPDPREQVYAFMRRGGSAAEARALARTLPADTPEGQDAIFLLQERAAEGGDPDAMLEVARYYDPADAAPSGSIVKDAEQAWLWYERALKADVPGARAAIERLHSRLEAEAAAGSARAAALLRRLR